MKINDKIKKIISINRLVLLVCLVLIIATSILYWQVSEHEFINFDDTAYVTENPQVQKGISIDNIFWAFSFEGTQYAYWHPLTWISHMVDCEFFGLSSGKHHLMNVFFHLANVMLLFFVFRKMTGTLWRSAFVAALFALHPINVDSVAWLAERKNLLSTFFWLLAMIIYFYYVKKPNIPKYILLVSVFILGLLSKPMLVTLPFVFVLLDFWPLKRFQIIPTKAIEKKTEGISEHFKYQGESITRLILEKVPLVILSVITIVISSLSISHGGSSITAEMVPMGLRIENATASYILYMWKMIWPHNLTFYYPYPHYVPLWQVAGSLIILLMISLFAVRFMFRAQYFIVGWLWFIGTLIPVSGIMQGGLWPLIAERWAYVPFIGLFIMIAWGLPDLISGWRYKRETLSASAAIVLLILMAITWKQVGHWKDDWSLFPYGIKVNSENFIAYANLGKAYAKQEEYEESIYYYEEALRLSPNSLPGLKDLGMVYINLGQQEKALYYYAEAVHHYPKDIAANFKLGEVYETMGDMDNAIKQFSQVINLDPSIAMAYYNIGVISAKKGEVDKAIQYFSRALRVNPNNAPQHFKQALRINPDPYKARMFLTQVLDYTKKMDEMIERLEQKRLKEPENPDVLHKLAVLYSLCGENGKALNMLFAFVKVQPDNPDGYYNIACIYARQNNINESIRWLQESFAKGFNDVELLAADNDLENIRGTEYYRKLMNTGL